MFSWQSRPRALWIITQDAQVTNERFLGISGANPKRIPDGAVAAVFHLRYLSINRNVNALRVYGGLRSTHFPPPGAGTEALLFKIPTSVTGFGFLRQPRVNAANAQVYRANLLPPWLLLEYTTAALGIGDLTASVAVDVTFIGPDGLALS